MTTQLPGMRADLPEALRDDLARRWTACRHQAAERGCDGLLVIGRTDRPGDLLYLAGHKPGMGGHVSRGRIRGRGFGAFYLPADAPPTLMTTTAFFEGTPFVTDVRFGTELPLLVGDTLRSCGAERSAVALVGDDVLTVMLYREILQHVSGVRWVTADDIVMGLRSRKSAYELECLRQGSAVADAVGQQARSLIRPGVNEREIGTAIIAGLRAAGASEASVTCQSGVERSAEPIAYPVVSDRVLENGDMLHMEINGTFRGYKIDICRSAVVGTPSAAQRCLLAVTLEMLEASIAEVRPGVRAASIGQVGGRIAQREGLERHFTVEYGGPATYVGHGIGVGSDEPPVLGLDDPTPLAEGMVLTIEPGLYRTSCGGCRIEDEVVVTSRGVEVLTALDRVWWE